MSARVLEAAATGRDASAEEDRRLLRELHGRGGDRAERRDAARRRICRTSPRCSRRPICPELLAELHKIGVERVLQFGSEADFKNASTVHRQRRSGRPRSSRSRLLLPDDARSVEHPQAVRRARRHAAGARRRASRARGSGADAVMRIETALAKAALDRVVAARSGEAVPQDADRELQALTPPSTGRATSAASVRRRSPPSTSPSRSSSRRSTRCSRRRRSADIKTYLRWQLVHAKRHSSCRSRSSTRTSASTARRCRAPRSCGRDGSAACSTPTATSAKRSAQAFVKEAFGPQARPTC